MKKTNGSVFPVNKNRDMEENMFFTYDEEEKQKNEINEANASHIFKPRFIPIYPDMLKFLTPTEAMIFGFIYFYKSDPNKKFYFTNQQLSEICNCNTNTVNKAISKIKKIGLITTQSRVRSGGGTTRFINDVLYNPEYPKKHSYYIQNDIANKNKINKNNIVSKDTIGISCENSKKPLKKEKNPSVPDLIEDPALPVYGNAEINAMIKGLLSFLNLRDFANGQKLTRMYSKHLVGLNLKYGKVEFRRCLTYLKNDSFHKKNMVKIKYLYDNMKAIIGTDQRPETIKNNLTKF